MKKNQRGPRVRAQTASRAERLLSILLDGEWHSTSELVRRVGHTFCVAKWVLVHIDGHGVEKRRHPRRALEFQYRLAPVSH